MGDGRQVAALLKSRSNSLYEHAILLGAEIYFGAVSPAASGEAAAAAGAVVAGADEAVAGADVAALSGGVGPRSRLSTRKRANSAHLLSPPNSMAFR
jgi:hypothetical protein